MINNRTATLFSGMTLIGLLFLAPAAHTQDRNREYRDRDNDRRGITRIEAGTVIPVCTNETIDVEKRDNRVYTGIVDQDVRGDDGRLAIPRNSKVELFVRAGRDNDLILDLESVTVNGERYAIKAEPNRVRSERDDSLVGAIVGAIDQGEARGRTVRVPRDTAIVFRVERPLDMGVADRGVMRDGRHYHDYYDDDRR